MKGDGKWNQWSAFNSCSSSCGGGIKTRSNKCTWSGGGAACQCPSGTTCNRRNCGKGPCLNAVESIRCNARACPGKKQLKR